MALVLALTVLLGACRRDGPARLESEPTGASVWLGDDILGVTPLPLPDLGARPISLRVALPGCVDIAVQVDPAKLPADRVVRVILEPSGAQGAVHCESDPPGAEVYLDGEFRGRTPLDLRPLEPRSYEVSFMMANRKSVTQTLEVAAGTAPASLRVELPSLAEEYYRQQIEKAPTNMHHYADLAHHLVVEHRFGDAAVVFGDAVTVLVKTPGLGDAERLWSEIERVVEKQYDYGSAEDVTAARKALARRLGELLKAYPDAPYPPLHVNYITALDALNERQQAQEAFERAWRRFPNEDSLTRLRRQGFAVP
jgi:hypothetical protein